MSPLGIDVDRMVELAPGVRAVALLNVPNTLALFDTHFPRFPVLPGVLLLEAMSAVARLVITRPHRQQAVRGARFRHYVRPGDQVRITVHTTAEEAGSVTFRAVAEVDRRTVATVRSLRFDVAGEEETA